MTGSREWADAIISDIRRIRSEIGGSPFPVAGVQGAGAQKLDPHAVAEALAEALKSDNAITQAISIRARNLQQKYPDRAA